VRVENDSAFTEKREGAMGQSSHGGGPSPSRASARKTDLRRNT